MDRQRTVRQPESIKLIIFDLGGVLIRLCGGWRNACRSAGVPYPAAIDDQAVASAVKGAMIEHEHGRIDDDQWTSRIAELTRLTRPQVQAVSCAWLASAYDGVEELVERIVPTGVKTACLSNTNAHHWTMMTGNGYAGPNRLPLDRLDYRFASHLLGAMKPDEAIYIHVERTIRIVPEHILFFDDCPHNCAAAADRGWCAHQIDPAQNTVAQMTQRLTQLGVF